jgi:hypothetical protein
VDDGDGNHVLPVTIRLPLVTINPLATPTPTPTPASRLVQTQTQTQTKTQTQSTHFIPAKERKALRKIALLESQLQSQIKEKEKEKVMKVKEKEYLRNDVRVGDTVRVKGRIDEYKRGSGWVRVVVVEPGSGGSIGMSSILTYAPQKPSRYHHFFSILIIRLLLNSTLSRERSAGSC